MTGYLANAAGPVPLVLDLRITHDRFGSSSDPSINGHLHYPNDLDGSLKETAADKIRQYHVDYNKRPSNSISFMPTIASTSGRLHSELVRLLFLQVHRETDRFFAASGVQFAQSDRGQFHYKRAAFSSQLKSKVGSILTKAAALWITLNIDGTHIASKSHSPITLTSLSSINLVSIVRCSSPPRNLVYGRRVAPSALAFSLSSHRHFYMSSV